MADGMGLCVSELRRADVLRFVEEQVETQVAAVEGEAPWPGRWECSEQSKVIRELAPDGGSLYELTQEVVGAHSAESFLVAFGRQHHL